jgi:hypothetical protein
MGTSSNVPSPSTPHWRPAAAALGRLGVAVERQSQEIWSAVSAERGAELFASVGGALVQQACEIARESLKPLEAIGKLGVLAARESEAGLTLDLARRALARVASVGGSDTQFLGELFAEMTDYYASRDLPSHVGAANRVASVSNALELKDALRQVARRAVAAVGSPPVSPDAWPDYVREIVRGLAGVEA